MLTALRNLFRPSYEAAVTAAETDSATGVAGAVPVFQLQLRHAGLMQRAKAAGLDPQTLLLLIQVFGPLQVMIVERWLAKRRG